MVASPSPEMDIFRLMAVSELFRCPPELEPPTGGLAWSMLPRARKVYQNEEDVKGGQTEVRMYWLTLAY